MRKVVNRNQHICMQLQLRIEHVGSRNKFTLVCNHSVVRIKSTVTLAYSTRVTCHTRTDNMPVYLSNDAVRRTVRLMVFRWRHNRRTGRAPMSPGTHAPSAQDRFCAVGNIAMCCSHCSQWLPPLGSTTATTNAAAAAGDVHEMQYNKKHLTSATTACVR